MILFPAHLTKRCYDIDYIIWYNVANLEYESILVERRCGMDYISRSLEKKILNHLSSGTLYARRAEKSD